MNSEENSEFSEHEFEKLGGMNRSLNTEVDHEQEHEHEHEHEHEDGHGH